MSRWLYALSECLPAVALPVALIAVGAVYLFGTRAFFIFHPLRALRVMLGKEKKEALSALSLALAGTLGVGNIAGVALAVAIGGAGSVFWMWVSALFAMFLKYGEVVLALLYKEKKSGAGGAMYYMRDAVGGRLGTLLSHAFCVLCLLCALTLGSSVQANAAAESLAALSVPPLFSGVMLALFAALAVFGGAKRIERVTSRLIPLLTLFYTLLSLYACLLHASLLPTILLRIFKEAFSPLAAASGGGVFLSLRAVRYGVCRGLLSNEAGAGTAPLAHATAKNTPTSQGLLGAFEVFIDTFVLCSATAFVVLLAFPTPSAAEGGVALVLSAFSLLVGEWTRVPLIFSVVLFVYATVICWCFYGERALSYFSESVRLRRAYLCVFLLLLAVGSVFSGDLIWSATDLSLCALTLINLLALLILFPAVKKETSKAFFTNHRFLKPFSPRKEKNPREAAPKSSGARALRGGERKGCKREVRCDKAPRRFRKDRHQEEGDRSTPYARGSGGCAPSAWKGR